MAYRLNGSSDYVRFSPAPLSGYVMGPVTLAAFFKPSTISEGGMIISHVDSGISAWRAGLTASVLNDLGVMMNADESHAVAVITSTSTWYLGVATWGGTDNTKPRLHVHDGTAWTHADGNLPLFHFGTVAGSDLLTASTTFGSASNRFGGDIVCMAIKKASATDLQVETLTRTSFQSWRDFGFDWLIGFDSSLEAAGVLQDQASPGTGDESAISGTTAVADPVGWGWVAASGTTYTKTGYATTGTVAAGLSESLFVETGRALVGLVASGSKTVTSGVTYTKTAYSTVGLTVLGGKTVIRPALTYTKAAYAAVAGFAVGKAMSESESGMPPAFLHDLVLTPQGDDSFALTPHPAAVG